MRLFLQDGCPYVCILSLELHCLCNSLSSSLSSSFFSGPRSGADGSWAVAAIVLDILLPRSLYHSLVSA